MMSRKMVLALLALALLLPAVAGCAAPAQGPATSKEGGNTEVSLGAITLNAHPASLDGKTVVLRWNSKPNGDKFLTRLGERLSEQYKGVKIVKMWEVDPSTAVISKDQADSEQIAAKIAAQKPDLVIASQAD